MNIVKASHVADSVIYNTFKEGYSDYPVKLTMDETAFIERFLAERPLGSIPLLPLKETSL